MKKKLLTLSLITVFVAFLGVSGAWAGHYSMERYGMTGEVKEHCNLELGEKFTHIAHMLIMSSDELGLTPEQLAKIKDIKKSVMQEMITKEAEANVIKVDICSSLWEDTINTEEINALVDKKYEAKKTLTKDVIKGIADLKGLLTEEQKGKLKQLCKQMKGH